MFNKINHSVSQNVSTPSNNRLRCRYCKSDMVQISDGKWDTFCCIKCGGRCTIYADEKDICSKKDSSISYIIMQPHTIIWDKIKFIDKLDQERKTR